MKHLQRESVENLIENKNPNICFPCVKDHTLAKIVLKQFTSVKSYYIILYNLYLQEIKLNSARRFIKTPTATWAVKCYYAGHDVIRHFLS